MKKYKRTRFNSYFIMTFLRHNKLNCFLSMCIEGGEIATNSGPQMSGGDV